MSDSFDLHSIQETEGIDIEKASLLVNEWIA
jgi:hypothetical protein